MATKKRVLTIRKMLLDLKKWGFSTRDIAKNCDIKQPQICYIQADDENARGRKSVIYETGLTLKEFYDKVLWQREQQRELKRIQSKV